MKRCRRWLTAAIAAVFTAALSLSTALASAAPFADFRIDASGLDAPERDISVDLYRRDETGKFRMEDTVKYSCKLNRATGDASFYIQPKTAGVWVTVDYLTDLDGNGVYELLDGGADPVWDVMDAQGGLALTTAEGSAVLSSGQTYILSPEVLALRSREAVQARSAGGTYELDVGQGTIVPQTFPLCMIKLHYTDLADGQDQTQTYYLEIYDKVLIPFDISPSDWYYEAVRYVLEQGYFSGTNGGQFDPDGKLTRAQLAQVLWTMAGSPVAGATQFTDVASSDWFYAAVSWCQQEDLLAGYADGTFSPNDLLSREQMVSVLHRYARYTGSNLRGTADLSQFSDGDQVSSWAVDSMRWALTNGLITGTGDALRPADTVARAELASVLHAYDLNLGLR